MAGLGAADDAGEGGLFLNVLRSVAREGKRFEPLNPAYAKERDAGFKAALAAIAGRLGTQSNKETWAGIGIAAVTLFVHSLAQHIASRNHLCPVAADAGSLRQLLQHLGCSVEQRKALVRSHSSSDVRGCPSDAEKGFGSTNVARVLVVVADAFGLGVPFRVVPPHRTGKEGNVSDFTDVMTDAVSTIAIFASSEEHAHRLDPSGGVARRLQQAGEAVGDEGSVLEVAAMFQRLAEQGPTEDHADDVEDDVDDVP